jgi:cellulase/cellobiase CelA1
VVPWFLERVACATSIVGPHFRRGNARRKGALRAGAMVTAFAAAAGCGGQTVNVFAPVDSGDSGAESSLVITRDRTSQWDNGYCDVVTVTDGGTDGVEWSVVLQVDGTISQLWNAVATETTGPVTFTGVDFNRRGDAAQNASFGFCTVL